MIGKVSLTTEPKPDLFFFLLVFLYSLILRNWVKNGLKKVLHNQNPGYISEVAIFVRVWGDSGGLKHTHTPRAESNKIKKNE